MNKRMKKLNLLLTLLIISFCSFAQKKLYLETGVGIPEGYHVGIGYRYTSITNISLKYGSNLKFYDDERFHLITLNNAFYFGKIHEQANRKLWSINMGLTTEYINNSHEEGNEFYSSGWVTREIVLTNRIMISPEIGVFRSIYSNKKIKDGIHVGSVILLPVNPKIGMSLIFNI